MSQNATSISTADSGGRLSSTPSINGQGVDSDSSNRSAHHQGDQHSTQDGCDPNVILVIHPGSRNLRLGRPSDSIPYSVLHAIARRQKEPADPATRRLDPHMVPLAKMASFFNTIF